MARHRTLTDGQIEKMEAEHERNYQEFNRQRGVDEELAEATPEDLLSEYFRMTGEQND